MSVLIKHFVMPKGCIYANDKDETEYCPMLNHDDVPFCQYIENEPEAAIGIDERPVYCPLEEYTEPCEDAVSRRRLLSDLKKLIVAWEKYPVMAEQLKGVETAIGYVEAIPSVTPKRKTGKWIYKRDLKQFFCDQCGCPSLTDDDCYIYGMDLPNFCEDCGADMRGEQDG